ncbi:MAG: FAD-binding protein [Bdellovibrionales bacterium]|nr:FAD-binding protein [Bdellovibrionales bacterium]
MSRTLRNIKLGLDESLEEHLAWLAPDHGDFRILRQSVDARTRHSPHFVYSVEVFDKGETAERPRIDVEPVAFSGLPVVILGAGPAGMFAALRLGERGIPTILLEQGSETSKRVRAITKFWRTGELDPVNNVGFGEGGAGLFSDGKLITRIKSEHIPYVMQRLVQFGAPAEIEYLSNPHVGSDRIRRVIPKLRERLRELGCQIRFDSKVEEVLTRDKRITGVRLASSGGATGEDGEIIPCERLVLACGHSSEDMFKHLHELGVFMEGKSFALGLRIEHPQSYINQVQFREHAEHPLLGAANYKLAYHDKEDDKGVYSFCMCPGGYVLSSATGPGGVVANGMSNFNRNSRFANAAIVVSVNHQESFGDDLFGGLKFRQHIEAEGLRLVQEAGGTRELPAQRLVDFLDERSGPVVDTSCPSGVVPARLDSLFSADFRKHFHDGLKKFDREMNGFISDSALLHGVESRTSCPVRITRDANTFQSLSHQGLYPAGEGAGYAGGITSAACDGIRIAEAIVSEVSANAFMVAKI